MIHRFVDDHPSEKVVVAGQHGPAFTITNSGKLRDCHGDSSLFMSAKRILVSLATAVCSRFEDVEREIARNKKKIESDLAIESAKREATISRLEKIIDTLEKEISSLKTKRKTKNARNRS